MNLHETLTNRHSLAHAVSIAFLQCGMRGGAEPAARATPTHGSRPTPPAARHLHRRRRPAAGAPWARPPAPRRKCDWRDMLDAAANGRQLSAHTTACYQQALADVAGRRRRLRAAGARQPGLGDAARSHGQDRAQRAPRAAILRTLAASVGASAVAPAAVRGPVTSLLEGLGPAHVDQVPTPVVALGGAAVAAAARRAGHLARPRARRAPRAARARLRRPGNRAWLSRRGCRPTLLPLYLACSGGLQH